MTCYSHSRIASFRRCPYSFAAQYLHKIPRASGLAATTGEIAHEFFEAYAEHCRTAQTPTDLEWARAWIETAIKPLPPDLAKDLRYLCTLFINSRTFPTGEGNFESKLAVAYQPRKHDWKFVPFDNPSALFRGVIDYYELRPYDDDVLFKDYKTGRVVMRRDQLAADFQFQSYAFLLALKFPEVQTITGVWDYVRFNYRTPPVIVQRETALAFGEVILSTVKAIEGTKEFKPEFNVPKCDYCDFLHHCPEYRRAVEGTDLPLEITGPEDAARLAAHMKLLDAGTKRIKNRLKKYVEEQGGVVVGDRVLDFHARTKRSFPSAEKAVDFLLSLDVNREEIWDKVRLTVKDVEALIKSLPEEEREAVLKLAVKTPETVFDFRKAKADEGEEDGDAGGDET